MRREKLPLAGFFLTTGIAHLTFGRKFFEACVPSWVPGGPKLVNEAAGVAELAGGAAVLIPAIPERHTRNYLLALLLSVYAANIQMAVKPESIRASRNTPRAVLWARLPLQIPMLVWVKRVLH